MTPDEIDTVVKALSGIASILRTADPSDKAEVYQQLGLELAYKPRPHGDGWRRRYVPRR